MNTEKVAFTRYKKLKDKYLVTNDIGRHAFLKPKDFDNFIEGKLDTKNKTYQELQEKYFIKDDLNTSEMIDIYRQRNSYIFHGTSLHIIVVTLRCNYNCIYCQASSRSIKAKGFDMDKPTAKAVVKRIFESPNKDITIEFQGGEPLANWPIVQYIVEEAERRNKKAKKSLMFSLVTNLSLMDEEKYDYIVKHMISVCTSLDGPKKLHNINRPFVNNDSYKATTSWIKKFKDREKKNPNLYKISALVTLSQYSYKYSTEIVDEYLKQGFQGIHLRPLSLLGFSEKYNNNIEKSAKEFLDFWKESIDYIIELNKKGKIFFERGAALMLQKIMTDNDPNFLDLRSPCGAGIGQLLYNHDGKVFTCDEGRMLGDDTFVLGNAVKNSYKELISHPNLRAVCQASILDNSPCDLCAYKPFCGSCPVVNYSLYGDLFAPNINNYRCLINMGMLDYLFEKLQDKKNKDIFKVWLGIKESI